MELANTILTEYHNSGDEWQSAMSNLDAVLDLRPKPDAHGPVRPRPLIPADPVSGTLLIFGMMDRASSPMETCCTPVASEQARRARWG